MPTSFLVLPPLSPPSLSTKKLIARLLVSAPMLVSKGPNQAKYIYTVPKGPGPSSSYQHHNQPHTNNNRRHNLGALRLFREIFRLVAQLRPTNQLPMSNSQPSFRSSSSFSRQHTNQPRGPGDNQDWNLKLIAALAAHEKLYIYI